jgi:hypothetical protein
MYSGVLMQVCKLIILFCFISFTIGCGGSDSGDRGSKLRRTVKRDRTKTIVPEQTTAPVIAKKPKTTLLLKPLNGKLSSRAFENNNQNIPSTVFYDIEIPIEPFVYRGKLVKTEVRLDFIKIKVAWRELAEREFQFPVNPEEGFIDGSVYLGGAHNPADVTRIKFGKLTDKTMSAEVDIRFDFEFEGVDEIDNPDFKWNVILELDPDELDKVAASIKK